jgi:hypothetical protein
LQIGVNSTEKKEFNAKEDLLFTWRGILGG